MSDDLLLFEKEAIAGSSEAQHTLGGNLYHDDGIENNKEQSRYWYKKAADQGHSGGQYCLGIMYLDGEGGPQDIVKGMELVRAATVGEEPDYPAAMELASIYQDGKLGFKVDLNESKKWSLLADEIRSNDKTSGNEG